MIRYAVRVWIPQKETDANGTFTETRTSGLTVFS